MLNIAFIKKDFIENFDSNYEIYLSEFINNSRFVWDNGNNFFKLNTCQSNGESDISNDFYELDFKIFADEETIVNKSNYSGNIEIDSNGVRIYSISNMKGQYRVCNLKKITSDYSVDELNKIKLKLNPTPEEAKVKRLLNKLEVNKNLLFLIPNIYYYDGNKVNDEILDFIVNTFSDDFKYILEYRKQYIDKDTYIAFFIEGYIVFLKEVNLKLIYYDKVDVSVSSHFEEIQDICNPY